MRYANIRGELDEMEKEFVHLSLRTSRIAIIFVLCLAVFLPFFAPKVEASPSTWSIETVDAAAIVGGWTSIALDSNNYPHISYHDNYWYDLKYARWTGSTWSIEPVDTVGTVGYYTSIALDSSDRPHISYCDQTEGNLKYAVWTGSTWSLESVDGASIAETSIALDSSDRPHISYEGNGSGYLKYAWWTGVLWSTETVDSGCVAFYSSLELDSLGRPHISYYDYTNRDLKYARWTGSSWSIEAVDSVGDIGRCTSLGLDSDDQPHISYWDYTNTNLKYARWTESTWSIETVDAAANVGDFTSIALDSNDLPHISYYDGYWNDLKYARWTGSEWLIEPVDHVGQVGAYNSIALDSEDHPHISYSDGGNANLKYARAPDEYFFTVSPSALDSNGDSFWDAMQIDMDVDTTYSGSLNVFVYAYLRDPLDDYVAFDDPLWSITSTAIEWGQALLYLPPGSLEGFYDVELFLFDGDNNYEGHLTLFDEVYLYPPDMRELTIQVDGSGSTNPVPGSYWMPGGTVFPVEALPAGGWVLAHWVLDSEIIGFDNPIPILMDANHVLMAVFVEESQIGLLEGTVTDADTAMPIEAAEVVVGDYSYVTLTDASGYYSFELPAGDYNVTAWDYLHYDETAQVTVIAQGITVQDFALQRALWTLIVEVEGSGTTNPPPGGYALAIGSEFVVEALPEPGWELDRWVLDSINVGADNPIPIIMNTDHFLIAFFVETPQPAIESCDQNGINKDTFNATDTVYVHGANFQASAAFDFYITEDVTWIDGMPIPPRVPETAAVVSSDSSGNIPTTEVWNDSFVGKYDVIVDVNGNGHYDEGVDVLDNNDVEVTAGFVVPELASSILLASLMLAAALSVLVYRRKSLNPEKN